MEALARGASGSEWLVKIRDLTVLRVAPQVSMVFACDALGGIGMKPLDLVRASAETVGHFSLRVPLLEVLCAGAKPFLVMDTLSVEVGEYGLAILAGIKRLAAEAGLVADAHFNGSMEKNVSPKQTGVGVTVAGMAQGDLPLCVSRPGDAVLLVGVPKSAPTHEVRIGDSDIVSVQEVLWLREQQGVHDMVPVGSRGARLEAQDLAASSHTELVLDAVWMGTNDVDDSGGPHTAVLVACDAGSVSRLRVGLQSPVSVIGELIEMGV